MIFDIFTVPIPAAAAFAITAGLEQMIEYIENLRFTEEDVLSSQPEYVSGGFSGISQHLSDFTGDIYAIPEGTVVFPGNLL